LLVEDVFYSKGDYTFAGLFEECLYLTHSIRIGCEFLNHKVNSLRDMGIFARWNQREIREKTACDRIGVYL
jgi:hypothetical protein